MRMSKLFSQTLRDAPADTEVTSHALLLRAGFISPLAAGIFSYLPLARRSMTKIENIMREEINRIGGQEMTMPVVQPGDLWKETGRWYEVGAELGRFSDKSGRDMALAMTHEEAVTDLVRREIRSYRQLPQLVYHIQTKWRDDPRPRAGLLRAREFTMLDSYSLDSTWEGLDGQYQAHIVAYNNIFSRCGLPVLSVGADVGMMGGSTSQEFMYLTPVGEDTLIVCEQCGYSANQQIAAFRKPSAPEETPKAIEKVATPGTKTIDQLARFLDIPSSKTAKALFVVATVREGNVDVEKPVIAIVRGDMEVSETKLANALRSIDLRPGREEEIRTIRAVPVYGSPIGVRGAIVVVDDAIPASPNLVAGANEEGYHLLNTNYGRDYQADTVADIAEAKEGDVCANCGGLLSAARGVEVGHIFKLGTRYSQAMDACYLDSDGKSKPVIMGSYGIGVGRLLACIAEEHHDERGLTWPASVAPFQVHLIALSGRDEQVEAVASDIYWRLQTGGIEVLYDDREESPGVKFADADLIGIPLRVTVSARSLQRGGAEAKWRDRAESTIVPLKDIVDRIAAEIGALAQGLSANST